MNAQMPPREHGIFGTYWMRDGENRWAVAGMNGIMFPGADADEDPDFFKVHRGDLVRFNGYGNISLEQMTYYMGRPSFLLKQRIVPVVAWVNGEHSMRCIGTAFFITCSGYLITASHVLLDPVESDYGEVTVTGNSISLGEELNMGVLVPASGIEGQPGYTFFQLRQARFWGNWVGSPLFHERPQYHGLTDIAVCRVDHAPRTLTHQPLSLSTRPFQLGDRCMTIGYAEMQDIPFETKDRGGIQLNNPVYDLYVSYGDVAELHYNNHVERTVPTPGPCFDYRARIPGKMSGAPIFNYDGVVVRGVVSRSFSGDRHAYGCLLSPILDLPIEDAGTSLRGMMANTAYGMPRVAGAAA
jgi:hypothetical protein